MGKRRFKKGQRVKPSLEYEGESFTGGTVLGYEHGALGHVWVEVEMEGWPSGYTPKGYFYEDELLPEDDFEPAKGRCDECGFSLGYTAHKCSSSSH